MSELLPVTNIGVAISKSLELWRKRGRVVFRKPQNIQRTVWDTYPVTREMVYALADIQDMREGVENVIA